MLETPGQQIADRVKIQLEHRHRAGQVQRRQHSRMQFAEASQHGRKCGLELSLHGAKARLFAPAVEGRSVVGDVKPQAGQFASILGAVGLAHRV